MDLESLKYFSELAKIQHYGKGSKGTEYFTAGTQVMRSSRWKKSTRGFRCFKKKGEM